MKDSHDILMELDCSQLKCYVGIHLEIYRSESLQCNYLLLWVIDFISPLVFLAKLCLFQTFLCVSTIVCVPNLNI